MEDIPFMAISNEELANKPPIGETVVCKNCGKEHKVEYANKVNPDGTKEEDKTLGFVKCGENSFLVAVAGKQL